MPPKPPFHLPRQKRSPLQNFLPGALRVGAAGSAVAAVMGVALVALVGRTVHLGDVGALFPDVGVVWATEETAQKQQPGRPGGTPPSIYIPAPVASAAPRVAPRREAPIVEEPVDAPAPSMTFDMEKALAPLEEIRQEQAAAERAQHLSREDLRLYSPWMPVLAPGEEVKGPTRLPVVVTRVPGDVPQEASDAGVSGSPVIVLVTVSAEGRPVRAAAKRGDTPLWGAAENAAMQWQFEPGLFNGKAIQMSRVVEVAFR